MDDIKRARLAWNTRAPILSSREMEILSTVPVDGGCVSIQDGDAGGDGGDGRWQRKSARTVRKFMREGHIPTTALIVAAPD